MNGFLRVGAVFFGITALPAMAQVHEHRIATSEPAEAAAWAARLQSLMEAGEIRLSSVRGDAFLPDRRHHRYVQLHNGVPDWGGELVVQSGSLGVVSVFGTLYEGIDLDTTPALSPEAASGVLRGRGAEPFGRHRRPELVVLPTDDGRYVLAYKIRARGANLDIRVHFVDAKAGGIAMEYADLQSASAVGSGTGVLGDRKKVSTQSSSGGFVAEDTLRPPRIATFDYMGDLNAVLFALFYEDLPASDLARDADNTWEDGANVDAHAYAGYTYDYYFKRFGRRG